MSKKPKSRQSNLVIKDLGKELLTYDLNNNQACCLNHTAKLVFNLCNGKRTVEEIRDLLSTELKSDFPEELIWLTLDQLKKFNLIEKKETLEIDFKGLSRRQVIKKIGLTTALAFPVISSLVAPSAAHAQSGCALNVCIAAGQNICAGCTGKTINTIVYTSTDGSCSGAGTPAASISCGSTGVTTTLDVKRT